jgi:8-oxo-dGTP diphosphatase
MVKKNEEELFLEQYSPEHYPRIAAAVDLLVFTIEEEQLKILMIRRKEMPFQGCLALPGVFVGEKETLDEAAARGILEETGLENIYFEQLYTWGEVARDPRMRILSISYLALVPIEKLKLKAGLRVFEVKLVNVHEILEGKETLAFDHREMIAYGRDRLKNKVEYTKIAFELVPEEFTLPQLQRVYEILLDKPLYKANFRKKVAAFIEETEKFKTGDAHRPSKYYTLAKAKEK